jgi:ketosteroid isomerase-like protein
MRPIALHVLLALAVASCAASHAPLSDEDRQAVVSEVGQAVEGLRDAMNAQDAEQVLSFYDLDPDFVYVSCTEFFFGTRFRTVADLYYRPSRGVTFEQELVKVVALSPEAAVVTIRGSSSRAAHLFWTQVWVKKAGAGWVIDHVHQSWPDCTEPRTPHPGTSEAAAGGKLVNPIVGEGHDP